MYSGRTSSGNTLFPEMTWPVIAQGLLVKYSPWVIYLTLLGKLPPF